MSAIIGGVEFQVWVYWMRSALAALVEVDVVDDGTKPTLVPAALSLTLVHAPYAAITGNAAPRAV